MKNRVIAGVAVLAVVLALVGLAVVAGRDSGTKEPAVLPVLGAGGKAAAPAADSSMRIAPTTYQAGKLPGLADEADAWKLPAARSDEGAVADLADVLGVEGQVTRTETGWTVGTDARRLDVQAVAGMPWSLYESIPADTAVSSPPASVECIKAPCPGEVPPSPPAESGVRGSSGSSGSGTATTPSPVAPDDPAACAADDCNLPMEPQRPADLPSKAEAERVGRALLTKLGVDLDQADVRVDDAITLWNVSADPVVGGLPTIGFTTSVSVGQKGEITYANGWLGEPTKGDRYPLIGTAAGVQRLTDEQARIMIAPVPTDADCEDCLVDPAQPEPRVVRITGVRLGLQVFSTFEKGADGFLVPTYLFSTEDGGELPVVAVADQYLGQQPVPDGHDEPGTPAEPSGPTEPSPVCAGSGSGSSDAGSPSVAVEVCASAPTVAGTPISFTVVGKGNLRDDCGSPVPEWGDGTDVAVCDIGCESLPSEPVELSKTFEHTYEKAGTYTVVFHLKGCGASSGTDQATVQMELRVEG